MNAFFTTAIIPRTIAMLAFVLLTLGLQAQVDTVCTSSTSDTFSISPVMGATSYLWTVPASAASATVLNDTMVVVDWTGAMTGDTLICVEAINTCGTSAATCYDIFIKMPDCTISGADDICASSTGTGYSTDAGLASYSWSVISGDATISGASNTANVVVDAGTANFTLEVTVSDGSGCTTTCTKNVIVHAVAITNIVANDPSVCATPDGSIAIAATGSDLQYSINGGSTFQASSSFTGLSGGSYSIVVRDSVTPACPDTDMVVLLDAPCPPIAMDDNATTPEETPLTVFLTANDSDPDGDLVPGSVMILTFPAAAQGTVINNADGSINFIPAPNFAGSVTPFLYKVCDVGSRCDTAAIFINVTNVNDPPIAINDTTTTAEDTPVTYDLSANDFDVDGNLDPASLLVVSTPPPSEGTVANNGDGTITFTPALNFNGGVTPFTYQICDTDGNCDQAQIYITVTPLNDPPIAIDDMATTNEDSPVVIDVQNNDSDPESDPLTTAAVISGPSNGGTNILNSDSIRYTPNPNFNGRDTFTYVVCDLFALCDTANVFILILPVDDPPLAVNDTSTTQEEVPVNIDLVANDTDSDGNLDPSTLTLLSVPPPAQGSVINNGDGTMLFSPAIDFNGLVTPFDYQVCDLVGLCDTATIFINVTPVNDPPVAINDTTSTLEDLPVNINLAANDSDTDGNLNPGSVVLLSVPPAAQGNVTNNMDGTITFVPATNFNGAVNIFNYKICDTNGLCDTAEVYINVIPVNDPPVALNDTTTTPEETPVGLDLSANDVDIDGNIAPATVQLLTTPPAAQGSVLNNGDGTILFSPAANFNGAVDAFDYSICDTDGLCDTAAVYITVTPVNDPPVAVNDTSSTTEDIPVTIDLSANDLDVDGNLNPATAAVISSPPLSQGAIVNNGDGTITFTPATNYNGVVNPFDYRICDADGLCDTATVFINVIPTNDPPTAINDTTSTPEDTPIIFNIVGNDSDPEGNLDPSTIVVLTFPPALEGGVVNNGDGTLQFVPAPNFHGAVMPFDYKICDSLGLCDTAMIYLTVLPVPDAPLAVNDTTSTLEDVPVTLDVSSNDSDPDGNLDPATTTLLSIPPIAQGTLLNNSDGTLTFNPAMSFNGSVMPFDYQICDTDGLCDTATVFIDVIPQNDPPIAANDTATTLEEVPVTVDVAANDSDVDGNLDPGTVSLITTPPIAEGTLTNNGDGTLTFTPALDFNGNVTPFGYSICDTDGICDTATVYIYVIPINDPPVAVDDFDTTMEDVPLTTDLSANDSDVDGNLDPATVSLLSNPPAGEGVVLNNLDGTITFIPALNFVGNVTPFNYKICDTDGLCAIATVFINITAVNDPPVAVNDTATTIEDLPVTIPVSANDFDIDNNLDTTTVTVVTLPPASEGLVTNNGDGSLTFTPATDYNGTVLPFDYSICDLGGLCDTATVFIEVLAENDPPIAVNDTTSTLEDTPLTIDIAANDSDVDGNLDPATITLNTLPPVSEGAVINNGDGTITFVPALNFNGPVMPFQYKICDTEGFCDFALVFIDVIPVNDPPIAVDDTVATLENTPVKIPVLANDSEPDGEPFTPMIISPPLNGIAVFSGDSIMYTPDAMYAGADSLVYKICDPGGKCDTAVVRIRVEDVMIDLALEKTLAAGQPDTVDLNDDVTYMITVINEGTFAAQNITVVDYIPAGMKLSPNDIKWTAVSTDTAAYTFAGPLLPGQSDSIELILRVVYGASQATISNFAEVNRAEDINGIEVLDVDSQPDNGNPAEDDFDEQSIQLLPHDPTGYIYCDKTGRIVRGGTIQISGPGAVYIVQNGVEGRYEFYTDGTPGLYTLSYNHPAGFPLSNRCTPQPGAIDPTTMTPPVMLGADTLGGRLIDTTCAANPYYLQFELEKGDPFIFKNNIPVQCILIGSRVCEDINGNNISDPGEPGLDGVTVELYTCADTLNPIATTVTSNGGLYRFDALNPGDYRVRFLLPAGYAYALANVGNDDSIDSDADQNGFAPCVTLNPGDCDTTTSVCLIPLSKIRGFVWDDLNYNGLQDTGEPGIENVEVRLFAAGPDTLLAATFTNVNGIFTFENLNPDDYYLQFNSLTLPMGYIATIMDANANLSDDSDSDASQLTGRTPVINLAPGFCEEDVDAGFYLPQNLTISGLTWKDCPANGTRQLSDGPLSDVPVFLTGKDILGNSVSESTLSDTSGNYRFTGLASGAYRLKFGFPSTPTGINLTLQNIGPDNLDSDPNPITGFTDTIFLMGIDIENIDAGYLDFEGPVITPTDPLLAGVSHGDTLTFECDAIPVMDQNQVLVTDNCGVDTVRFVEFITSQADCAQTGYLMIMRCGWVATDVCGNSSRFDIFLRIVDTAPPVFISLPGDTTVTCDAIPAVAAVTASDICDDSVSIALLVDTIMTGTCPYTIARTWTASDDCGNSTVHTQVITVIDTTAPVFTSVPGNVVVSCDNIPPVDLSQVKAVDQCDSQVGIAVDESSSGICPAIITRIFTAVDDCGNASTAIQSITVVDTVAPVITHVPADTIIDCNAALPIFNTPIATDNCDASPDLTGTIDVQPGNCPAERTYVYTWTATDTCGNTAIATHRVLLRDTAPPAITQHVPASYTLSCTDSIPQDEPQFSDDCSSFTVTFNQNITTVGCSEFINKEWIAVDACGNSRTVRQQIEIRDDEAPVFVFVPADTVVNCNEPLPFSPPLVKDNCNAVVDIELAETRQDGACPQEYTLIRIWTATDDCGNASTARQVIEVRDTVAPLLIFFNPLLANLSDGDTLDLNCNNIPRFGSFDAKAADNCDTQVEVIFEDLSVTTGDCRADGYLLLMWCRWSATDDCGNVTAVEIYMRITDTTPPVFTSVPADTTINCGDPIPGGTAVVAEDDCADVVDISVTETTDTIGCGIQINRIWTATDECGNTATAMQIINVVDTIAPVFTIIPADTTISCEEPVPLYPASWVTDNCDARPHIDQKTVVRPGNCIGEQIIQVTVTATDYCGNQSQISYTVFKIDNVPPVVLVPVAPVDTVYCGTSPQTGTPVFADACSAVSVELTADTTGQTCGFQIQKRWVASDDCDNETIVAQTLFVIDTTAPVFVFVPADTVVNCEDAGYYAAPVVTDDCADAVRLTFAHQRIDGSCINEYTLIRTWTATDDCNNSSTARQRIIVKDTSAPQLIPVHPLLANLPYGDTLVLLCDSLQRFSAADVIAVDNCTDSLEVLFEDLALIDGDCPVDGYRLLMWCRWSAEDDCGNVSDYTIFIKIVDTIAPVIIGVPDDLAIPCGSNPPPPASVSATDNCSYAVDIDFEERVITGGGNCPTAPSIRREWTATDECGNQTTATQVIHFIDTIAPSIEVFPPQLSLNCDEQIPSAVLDVSDNCDPDVEVQMSQTINSGNCPNEYTLIRTWTASDNCGNQARTTQVVQIFDNQAPVLIGIPADTVIDLSLGQRIPPPAPVIAVDNCDTTVVVIFNEERIGNNCNYTLRRTWRAEDACGNSSTDEQFINVKSGNIFIELSASPDTCTANKGSAGVTITGGTSPHSFLWSTGDTTQYINGLSAGWYTLTVSDALGCSVTDSIEVGRYRSFIEFTGMAAPDTCGQGVGSASISALGGAAPYSYVWGHGATGSSVTGLFAGHYEFSVTDANGCKNSGELTVGLVCPCNMPEVEDIFITPSSCADDDGTATINVFGLPDQYNYNWSPDAGTPNAAGNARTNLPSGTYQVTISDPLNPNCPVVENIVVPQDCPSRPCDPIFTQSEMTVEDADGNVEICLPVSGNIDQYNLLIDGTADTTTGNACDFDTLIYYSYALLNGGGQDGPYRIDDWTINGSTLNGNVVHDMDELVNLLQTVDPDGHWSNDYNSRTLSAGRSNGTYTDLTITHLNTLMTVVLQVNKVEIPFSKTIALNGHGDYSVVLLEINGNCADTLQISVKPDNIAGDIVGAKFDVITYDCNDAAPQYCIEDISWVNIDEYIIRLNGVPYAGAISGCNYQENFSYNYFEIPGAGLDGPYTLNAWYVNGDALTQVVFNDIHALLDIMRKHDPNADWQLDTQNHTIKSLNNYGGIYSDLRITQNRTGIITQLERNANLIPGGIALVLEPGMQQFTFERKSDGKRDTLDLAVACLTQEYIYADIYVGDADIVCAPTGQLVGSTMATFDICADDNEAAEFLMDNEGNCFTCKGIYVGETTACMVTCDEYGICDTTFVIVTVRERTATIANNDTVRTTKNTPVVANPATNDILPGRVTSLRIVTPPAHGRLTVNPDFTVTYEPDADYCDDNVFDFFTYEVCTGNGDCDNGIVFVQVACDAVIIYTGFSPNKDGRNEYLRIDGLERYPDNKLTIFNRWGNEVYHAQGYQNDWQGDWKGKVLPAGTYFYFLELNDTETKSGYIQISH